jgi:hypothetical protein
MKIALGLAEGVAPGLTQDVAPGSEEDARPNLALNSVAGSAGDLSSMVCRGSTKRLVEEVLLVGADEIWGRGGGGGGRGREGG